MDKSAERQSHEEEHVAGLHGNTPAAWTAVTIVLFAFTLGAIAMVIGPNWPLFWVSVGIAIAGGLVGKVMQLMGFGVKPDGHDGRPGHRDSEAAVSESAAADSPDGWFGDHRPQARSQTVDRDERATGAAH